MPFMPNSIDRVMSIHLVCSMALRLAMLKKSHKIIAIYHRNSTISMKSTYLLANLSFVKLPTIVLNH